MAAREHQGLQIALIIFVVLTIVLSVTTFMFFSSYDEEQIKFKKEYAARTEADKVMKTAIDDVTELKTLIGVDNKLSVTEIKALKDKDMADHGAAFPDTEKNYRHLVEYLNAQFRVTSGQVSDRDAREAELQAKIKADEDTKTKEHATLTEGVKKSADDLAAERDKFNQDRTKMKTDADGVAKQLEDKRKELDDVAKKTGDEINRLGEVVKKLLNTNKVLLTNLEKDTTDVTMADGHVTWVNQKERTVWLDQGTADGLTRQTSFSVIDAAENNPGKAPKKGRIEIVRIQGPHLSEARIVEDDIHNLIMPGDQVMSPVYQPGRSQHFALAGFMDIDADGQSDRATIRNLIGLNGGAIDAEVADNGAMTGEVTSNTRYLVMGDRPTDKASNEVMTNIGKIIEQARTLGVRTMSVAELVAQMGYKSPDRTVQLGAAARSEDFKARFPGDVQPKAPSPLNNFRPRRPAVTGEAKSTAY